MVRAAGLGEEFRSREIYFVSSERALSPEHARTRGFAHLAWVDLHRRLGGAAWPAPLFCSLLLVLGIIAALRATQHGADPT